MKKYEESYVVNINVNKELRSKLEKEGWTFVNSLNDKEILMKRTKSFYKFIKRKKTEQPQLEKDGWTFVRDLDNQQAMFKKIDKMKIYRLRHKRNKKLTAFDKFKTNQSFFREPITSEDAEEIKRWYEDMLDLKEEAIRYTPKAVKRYL